MKGGKEGKGRMEEREEGKGTGGKRETTYMREEKNM